MSYILDALKRSEQERHQGELNHPTIDTIMLPKRQAKQQLWPYLLILVLMINIGVYAYIQLLKSDSKSSAIDVQENQVPQEQNPVSASRSAAVAQPNMTLNQTTPSQTETRALPESFSVTPNLSKRTVSSQLESISQSEAIPQDRYTASIKEQPAKPVRQLTEDGFEIIRPKGSYQEIPSTPVENIALATYATDYSASTYSVNEIKPSEPSLINESVSVSDEVANFDHIQHLRDMDLEFQRSVPDIKFSSHIYSPSPEARRVMLNDLYLREGQDFSGMTIDTIGEFYIVLSKNEQEFKIPVLRDWYRPN